MPTLEINEEQIIALLAQMPSEQRERVLNYFRERSANFTKESPPKEKPRPVFGSGKDAILYMADDFDAPLEDFADYM
jgi:hypothetical protein